MSSIVARLGVNLLDVVMVAKVAGLSTAFNLMLATVISGIWS
ncbi:MAG: hypothetical protein SFZ03_08615 [Candidatus Melainabacteria bacterium]|nr:hypothetical protein [Candidatus Melainabacteria bacterium]